MSKLICILSSDPAFFQNIDVPLCTYIRFTKSNKHNTQVVKVRAVTEKQDISSQEKYIIVRGVSNISSFSILLVDYKLDMEVKILIIYYMLVPF